ncbi:MAG: SGNH/GDSL hydrolase family protein [Bilifractor sp.]
MDIRKISLREKIGFFLVLILLLILGSRAALGYARKCKDSTYLKRNGAIIEMQEEPANTVKVLVLGDSLSYTTVSPMKVWKDLGIPVYTAGQSGQTMNEMYNMLTTALDTQHPDVVLIETHSLLRSAKDLDEIQNIIASRAASVLPIFQYHNLWKNMLKPSEQKVMHFEGFTIRTGVKSYTGPEDYMGSSDKKADITQLNLLIFDKVLELCRQKGIKVVLYSAPSPKNYTMEKHNALQALADTHQLTYIDLNQHVSEMGINWQTDTLDEGDHLNISGADRTTAYLEEHIIKTLNLADERNNVLYKNWNREEMIYEQAVDENIAAIRSAKR